MTTIVALDGPAGAGKSSVARGVAKALGVPYLDTGAMYRALGWLALERGIDPADRAAATEMAESAEIELVLLDDGEVAVHLFGEAVEEKIRTTEVGVATSKISTHSGVRRRLVELQRSGAARFGAVVEGRDIGTVVFPETPFKFFLTADPTERARRRILQLREAGKAVDPKAIEEEISDRDRRDSQREDSPLAADESYTVVDSTGLSKEEVVRLIEEAVRSSLGEWSDSGSCRRNGSRDRLGRVRLRPPSR